MSRQRAQLHPRRRTDRDTATPLEGLEASTKARFEAAPKDGKARRFKEFYDGAASWSRVERVIARVEVGAEGPDTRFVVTNLKKRNARALYEDIVLPARPGRKSHQILENASGGGPHLLHEGHRQSVTAVPARRRLLPDVGPARVDAKTFDVARRPVRHLTPAPHQDRRARRRDEDNVTCSFADIVSRPRYLAFRSRANPAPRRLSDGWRSAPTYRSRSCSPVSRADVLHVAHRRARSCGVGPVVEQPAHAVSLSCSPSKQPSPPNR